jgi:uncharacterized membrane protein YfcA
VGEARWRAAARRAGTPLRDLTIIDLLLATLIVAAGALVQSTIGFGVALVAVPFLVMLDPSLVPGPFLLASLVLALLMILRDRIAIDLSDIRSAILGLVIGTGFGAGALLVVPEDDLPELFGVLILLAIASSVLGVRVKIGAASLLVAGLLGGIMGTMAGVHGPAMALLYQAERGERVRATLGAFFVVGYAISIAGLVMVDLFGRDELAAGLALSPGVILGWLLAPLAIARIDTSKLQPIILTVAALAAIAMVVTG